MASKLKNIINRLGGVNLDPRIPLSYMMGLAFHKFWGRLVAIWKFRRNVNARCYASSIIKCPSKIKVAGRLNIGRDCYIDALSTDGISFGKGVFIGRCTTIECTGSLKDLGKGLVVGDSSGLGTHGFYGCAGGVTIGNQVMIGNFVSFHSENHNFSDPNLPMKEQGVSRLGIKIGDDCWIGAKVTLLDGVSIGMGCIVAAGAVVPKGEYPDYSIIAGVPAKVIKSRKNE